MATVGGGVKGLLARAKRAAKKRGQRPATGHLLLVMLHRGDEAGRLLAEHGVEEMALLAALREVPEEPASTLERALERAENHAALLGDAVGAMHVLLAVVRDTRTTAYRTLVELDASPERMRDTSMACLGMAPTSAAPPPPAPRSSPRRERPRNPPMSAPNRPSARRMPTLPRKRRGNTPVEELSSQDPSGALAEAIAAPPASAGAPGNTGSAPTHYPLAEHELDPKQYPTLTGLGRNLTALAADGRIDPVVGRDAEIELLLDVLARRRSNNPVLVGPPGVGKTAIVEGLALRLANGGEGVRGLEDRIVIETSAGALVSGTGVRGALSDRIRKVREEVERAQGRVILFIDEIHAVVGGGDGPDDLAHELKGALARGTLPCIGATTDAEYRKHFERDAALVRRFSPVRVDEPSPSDAITILRGIAPRYELHHAVALHPDALRVAVELSVRFLPERHLPDKAIGIMDLAAARVRRRGGDIVDVAAIAGVVAEQARVPVERLLLRDGERLLALEELLGERVVGHEAAMARISDALRKGAAGFRGRRPLATFLLLGPTGVGKTETAKAVAEVFFPGAGMSRFDMSEFSEPHAVARLLGAPPGYVGHEEGGQLTEAVRGRPYQLLLFDEMEKAHPDVVLAMLPLLDEGRLTDGRGRTVDFTNTIVVLTSNLGAGPAVQTSPRIGFGSSPSTPVGGEARALMAARRALAPELWNRIDEPLYFAPLEQGHVATIARRLLAGIATMLRDEQAITLEVRDSAIDALIEAGGYDPELGARPMRRTIGRLVEAPLASALLGHEFTAGDVIQITGSGASVHLSRAHEAEAAE